MLCTRAKHKQRGSTAPHTASMDGVRSGQLAVFLVHVVRSRARVVAQPNAKIFDFERLFLKDLA